MGKDASENPMRLVKVEKLVLNARVVKVVTDQFALRRRCSRLKEGFSHTESLGVRKERGKSPDDDEVISTLQKAIESLQEKDHQGGDRFHQHNVPNIQMTMEKIEKTVEVHQLQFSYQAVDVQLSRNDECL